MLRSKSKCGFELKDRKEIIEKIAAVFQLACPESGDQQPHIYFRGKDVHVHLESPVFLEALWRKSISFRGQDMVIISKGLRGGGFSVYKVQGLEAEKLENFRTKLEKEYSCCRAIVALNYDIAPLGGGPVFSGDLFMFSSKDPVALWDQSCSLVNWAV